MKITGYVDGKQIERSKEDLDYIEMDIVEDFVRQHKKLEANSNARIEIDFSNLGEPVYNLINCGQDFTEVFYNNFRSNKKGKATA